MQMEVRHNEAEQRFEVRLDGKLARADYRQQGDIMVFTHTEVPEAFEGEGVGGQLARAGLDYARQQGYRVDARCRFIAAWLERHPEYHDLRPDRS